MITREYLRSVTMLANNNQPVSTGEFRELLLRHLLSNGSPAITEHLIEIYLRMNTDTSNVLENDHWRENIYYFFEDHYKAGYQYGIQTHLDAVMPRIEVNEIPDTLPQGMDKYPKDIVANYATILGFLKATA